MDKNLGKICNRYPIFSTDRVISFGAYSHWNWSREWVSKGITWYNYHAKTIRWIFPFFTCDEGPLFWDTIMHGGAKYRSTRHGFVIRHKRFAKNYQMYSRSHHVKPMDILIILIYFKLVAQDFNIVVCSSMFILVASWLYIRFIFNPLGFSWNKIVEDWED